MQDVCVETTE